MLPTVEGRFRNGQIELAEIPQDITDETRVLVTFLTSPYVDRQDRGITAEQAADLRARLAAFAEEWNSPEMDIYDQYESAKEKLSTG